VPKPGKAPGHPAVKNPEKKPNKPKNSHFLNKRTVHPLKSVVKAAAKKSKASHQEDPTKQPNKNPRIVVKKPDPEDPPEVTIVGPNPSPELNLLAVPDHGEEELWLSHPTNTLVLESLSDVDSEDVVFVRVSSMSDGCQGTEDQAENPPVHLSPVTAELVLVS
jgi:hypothetical protein